MAVGLASASSQYIQLVVGASVSSYPISFWINFKHDSVTNGPSALTYANVSVGERRFVVEVRGDMVGDPVRLRCANQTGTVTAITSSNGYTANTWQRFGARVTSTTDGAVFLNGTKTTSASNAAFPASQPSHFVLGADMSGGTYSGYINGAVGFAAMWNVALTDDEFNALEKGFSPRFIRPAALKVYARNVRPFQDAISGAMFSQVNSPTVAEHHRTLGM